MLDLDFGQIVSGVVVDDTSGVVQKVVPQRRAAGEIVSLRPNDPRLAEVLTAGGEYLLLVVAPVPDGAMLGSKVS